MKNEAVQPSVSLFEWMSCLQDRQERLRHCKIVATIGPSSSSDEIIVGLIKAGMNIARLNFSHGDHSDHLNAISRIRRASKKLGKSVAILQDLQGPKIRCGILKEGVVDIRSGARYALVCQKEQSLENMIPIDYGFLMDDLEVGDRVFMDDGLLQFKVIKKNKAEVVVKSMNNGVLKNRKGINFPDSSLSIPSLTQKDRRDMIFGVSQNVDMIALSFVQTANDILECQQMLTKLGCDIPVIAKIEKLSAMDHLDEIANVADGLMVARGDLGVEVEIEKVPNFQRKIIAAGARQSKTVIIATQMLESMIKSPRPTLAEVSDVVNGVLEGTDCVMLSAETASGKYPVKCVEKMSSIINSVESWSLSKIERYNDHIVSFKKGDENKAIAHAACEAAEIVKAKLIVCLTLTGSIARLISKWRPKTLVVAISPNFEVIQRLNFYWGVYGIRNPLFYKTEALLQGLPELLKKLKIVNSGDRIVVTAGIPMDSKCPTNMIKINEIR